MNNDQAELIDQLVYAVGPDWAGPMLGRQAAFDPLVERLDGIVFSLLTQLDGEGGINHHRLASKAHPDVDLLDLDWSPRHAYPLLGAEPPADVPAELGQLLAAIEQRRDSYPRMPLIEAARLASIGDFIEHVLRLIEQGFTLTPIGGADIAPGLTEAFAQAWAQARP